MGHAKAPKIQCIGILTAGGDCPGLNAAIRAVARAAMSHGMRVVGIQDGFRGLVEHRASVLKPADVSGILTLGGTILGTSRDKPHKMPMGKAGKLDMTAAALANYEHLHLDCLVCLGGNGTQKNALHLAKTGGINVITLPKTIDNDVAKTDITFGFYTALLVATEAIDRLHTTAESHHRIMVVEVMGHQAGWLTLASGVSGGADVVLIPEIPYDPAAVAASLKERMRSGKRFSIVAVAEGACTIEEAAVRRAAEQAAQAKKSAAAAGTGKKSEKEVKKKDKGGKKPSSAPVQIEASAGQRVAHQIQQMTGIETRVTVLSHLQRGGTPSPADRMIASQFGVEAIEHLAAGQTGFMIAMHKGRYEPVPLEEVAGKLKLVPLDHELIRTARRVGTCLGD